MQSERLFIALPLPPAVRDVLAGFAQPLAGVNWTDPAQLHLTLRFLGDVTSDQLEVVLAKLATVRVAPFILPLESVGSFPPNHPPRVLWISVGSGHPRLFQLRQRIDDALLAARLTLDLRTFHPHVTLARCTEQAAPTALHWLHTHREASAPPFQVESFDLYASELRPEGAVHTLKQRFPLAK